MKYLNLLIIFFCHLSAAQQNKSISWGELPPEEWVRIKAAINEFKPEEHDEFTEVLASSNITIEQNVAYEKTTKVFYFPDTNAIQNKGIDRVIFNNELDKIKFLSITTLTKEGKEKYFSKEDLKINDSNSYNTFSSTKNAVFSYPGLEIKSFAVLSYIINKDIENRESDWSKEIYPQIDYPRENYTLNVQWPKNMAIQWHNSSKFVKCQENDNSIICNGEKIPKALSDHTFFWADQLDTIQIGQHKNWNETIDHVLKKFKKSQTDITTIKSFTEKLVGNKNSMEEKISSIQKFVAQEIQYISLSEHGNAITPHKVSTTLEKRMGDCKDKSALLFSMLTTIGLKPYPVLVATEREKIAQVYQPSTNIFDHMIVCFNFNENKYCIDATNPHSHWKYISPDIQGKVSLPLLTGSSPENIPSNAYLYNFTVHSKYVFLENGGQTENQRRDYFDEYTSKYRSFFSEKNTKEINDWLIDDYHENVANNSKPELTITGLKAINENIVVTSKTEFEPYIDTDSDLDYSENDAWVLSELNSAIIPNKIYEYNNKGLKITSISTFDISKYWEVKILPSTTRLNHKYGSLYRTSRKTGDGKIEVKTTLEIPKKIIPFEEIEKFNSFIELLKIESSINLYGKKLDPK